MNIIILSGRVTKEINVKGKVGYISFANERPYPFNKDQNGNEVSNFINLKFLGEKNIERAQKYLVKGTAILVKGYYFRDSWKADGGEWKEMNYVLVQEWEYQKGKSGNEEGSGDNSFDSAPNDTQQNTQNPPQQKEDDFMTIPPDLEASLPFR